MEDSRIWLADGEKMYVLDTSLAKKKWKRLAGFPKNLWKRVALLPQIANHRLYISSIDGPGACGLDVELDNFDNMPNDLPAIYSCVAGDRCMLVKTADRIKLYDYDAWPKLELGMWPAMNVTSNMACARIGDLRFFVCGGVGQSGRTARCDILTQEGPNGVVIEVAPMKRARSHHICVVLPGKRVLVAGGLVDYEKPVIIHAEIYDIEKNKWFEIAPMMYPRYNAAAVVIDGGKSVLIFGGLLSTPKEMLATETERKTHQDQFVDACEIFDIEANMWRLAPEYNNFTTFDSPRMCSFAPLKN